MSLHSPLSPQFLKLLEMTGVCKKGFVQKIIKGTQKKWYQPGERERFKEKFQEKSDEILPLIKDMGIFEEKRSPSLSYDYCLILGGDLDHIKKRFTFLLQELNRGVFFKQLVFLTGQRSLNKKEQLETQSLLNTEVEMMWFIWKHLKNFPKGLQRMRPLVIDAPALLDKERPTTESTVIEWLKSCPKPGNVLVVSSAPYIGYQNSILTYLLFPNFQVDTVGCGSSEEIPISVLIDDLAKWFLWEAKRMNKQIEKRISK